MFSYPLLIVKMRKIGNRRVEFSDIKCNNHKRVEPHFEELGNIFHHL